MKIKCTRKAMFCVYYPGRHSMDVCTEHITPLRTEAKAHGFTLIYDRLPRGRDSYCEIVLAIDDRVPEELPICGDPDYDDGAF